MESQRVPEPGPASLAASILARGEPWVARPARPAPAVPERALPPAERPSAELFRLLNAALIDPQLGEQLLTTVERAGARAALAPGPTFGCELPDPVLRLTPIRLSEADWVLLREMSERATIRSLADMWRYLEGIGGGT
ncbi:MAG TPA: hypothetical protein VHS99_19735 [Chloroflexota bacterium]|nr:hypothetical protein [Chloroflexota bacterium]